MCYSDQHFAFDHLLFGMASNQCCYRQKTAYHTKYDQRRHSQGACPTRHQTERTTPNGADSEDRTGVIHHGMHKLDSVSHSSSGEIRTRSISGSKPKWSAGCLPSQSTQGGSRTHKSDGFKPSRFAICVPGRGTRTAGTSHAIRPASEPPVPLLADSGSAGQPPGRGSCSPASPTSLIADACDRRPAATGSARTRSS